MLDEVGNDVAPKSSISPLQEKYFGLFLEFLHGGIFWQIIETHSFQYRCPLQKLVHCCVQRQHQEVDTIDNHWEVWWLKGFSDEAEPLCILLGIWWILLEHFFNKTAQLLRIASAWMLGSLCPLVYRLQDLVRFTLVSSSGRQRRPHFKHVLNSSKSGLPVSRFWIVFLALFYLCGAVLLMVCRMPQYAFSIH